MYLTRPSSESENKLLDLSADFEKATRLTLAKLEGRSCSATSTTSKRNARTLTRYARTAGQRVIEQNHSSTSALPPGSAGCPHRPDAGRPS